MIGTYLVHGWMHLFMVQVDCRLFGTGWCMVDALVYGSHSYHKYIIPIFDKNNAPSGSNMIFPSSSSSGNIV
jgi:hypothetical protein